MKMKIRDSAGSVIAFAKDMIYPGRCLICRSLIPISCRTAFHSRNKKEPPSFSEEAAAGICSVCLSKLPLIRDPYCEKCGKPLLGAASKDEDLLCSDCRQKIRLFRQCRCLLLYDEAMMEMMAELKFRSHKEGVYFLAALAEKELGSWICSIGADCIVPVPMYYAKEQQRGYNQTALIAEQIGLRMNLPVPKAVLIRKRSTKAQKNLSADQRLINLSGAFSAATSVKNKTILIVDDIYTTGATMEACTEVLLRAGAKEVYGLCICSGFGMPGRH